MSKTPQKNTAKPVKKPTKAAKPAASKAKKPRAQSKIVKTAQPVSLSALQTKVITLQANLKRNDTVTKKRVIALEATLETLQAQTTKSNSTQKAALTRKFNQLTQKISEMGEQTRSSVNSELKSALKGSINTETLGSALYRAQMKLKESEQAQAHALAKINHHLAAMASAVDTRFAAVETQIAELQAMQSNEGLDNTWQQETTSRIEILEQDTATALGRVGDKMTEITQELSRQSESHTLSIREKVAEIAMQTQSDLEQNRANIENRLTNIEAKTQETPITRRLEQTIAALSARIEGLEYDLSLRPPTAEQSLDTAKPQLSLVDSAAVHQNAPSFDAPDAFSPAQLDTNAQPNPYLPAEQVAMAEIPAPVNDLPPAPVADSPPKESHVPQEFNPAAYQAQTLTPSPALEPATAMPVATIMPVAETQPDMSAAPLPHSPAAMHIEPPAPTPAQTPPMPEQSPAMAQAAPYADPAYAETDAGLMGDRIVDTNERKFALPKIGGLSGRNVKVAGMAAGVAIVGLLAAKTMLGTGEITTPQDFAKTATAPKAAPTAKAETQIIETIGEYADNRAPEPVTGEAAITLNSAAASGDSAAQFQLGLSYLEQGRTDEGVSLIRQSANQNQPAAQYRLAKLYEIGEGVSQDAQMARQLTERAARNGNRIAMHDLALYFAEGRGGVEADLKTASQWFEKAAQRGVVDSQFNLGVLFESGQGLPKNVTDAFVWYSIAAAQGDQFAKKRVEVLSTTLAPNELEAAKLRVAGFKPVKVDDSANGIFRNVPWNTQTAKKSQDVTQVRQVQSLLNDLGYDVGGADGAIGPRTRSAIIEFERVNGLPETGRVNTALISRLELAAGT